MPPVKATMIDANAPVIRASRGAFAIALTLATACLDHDPCANIMCAQSACVPPFTLAVTDEITRQPLSGASATSPGLSCTAPFAGVVSCAAGAAQDTYAVDVSAPGHVTKQVQVVVGSRPPPDACGCQGSCQSWDPSDVPLAPSSP
jgi:hypothetical protein